MPKTHGDESSHNHHPSTLALHADDPINLVSDVAPPIHLSSTFRYSRDPATLVPARDQPPPSTTDPYIYSREDSPTLRRLEIILESLLHAPSVCYSSGLAALHGAYVFLNPKRIAIGDGYHGSHGVLDLFVKLTGAKVDGLDQAEEELGDGDVIHLETPLNPYGTALDVRKYKEIARRKGALLLVDSTFGPPGLQDPFLDGENGADVVMHSGTKYLGGHSDMLWGVLATKNQGWADSLRLERMYLGSIMGGLEGWLGVRSLRTLEVRVRRQSDNAQKLVAWLARTLVQGKDGGHVSDLVADVKHASLQAEEENNGWIKDQMPGGFGPVFAIIMKTESLARRLPSKLELFSHATSLGGVETLIEWRAMSDKTTNPRLCRVSVGLEHWEDLRDDIERGLRMLYEEEGSLSNSE